MKTKRCAHCGKEKLLILFAHDRTIRDGRARRCKTCQAETTKCWQRENLGHGVGKMPGVDLHSIRSIRS